MLKDLNLRPSDQHHIDSRLIMMYNVTYNLEAILASEYPVRNTRESRHIHILTYRQIRTLKDYYRLIFFPRTINHWNALPAYTTVLPSLTQFSNATCHVISVCVSLNAHPRVNLLTILTPLLSLYKLISSTFLPLFQLIPSSTYVLCSMLIGNSSTSWSTVLIDVNVVVYYKSLVLLSLPIFTILKMSNCKRLIGPLCVHRSYHQNVKECLRLIYILYTKSQHHVKRINSHNYNSSCAHTPRQVNMFF